MHTRPLGKTGLHVPPIALGTVKLGRTQGLKYPGPQQHTKLPTNDHVASLVALAHDLGIRFLDTAPAYGVSEERLGQLLNKRNDRDTWTICTKAGETFTHTPTGGQSTFDFTPQGITASIERSLTRLQTDRIEIALLHSDGNDEHIINNTGAIEALEKLKHQGKVLAVGVSTKTPAGAILAAQRTDAVMLTLNAQTMDDAVGCEAAATSGAGVLVKKAFASGHSVQTPQDVETSLKAIYQVPAVSSIVIGTANHKHLQQNVEAATKALDNSSSPAHREGAGGRVQGSGSPAHREGAGGRVQANDLTPPPQKDPQRGRGGSTS